MTSFSNLIELVFRLFLGFMLLMSVSCTSGHTRFSPDERSNSSYSGHESSVMKEGLPSVTDLATGNKEPPEAHELGGVLKEGSRKWFYGPGIGKTMANVGAIIFWPPYAVYVVGNAAISLAGYEPLYVTNVLPERARDEVLFLYESVTSVPGMINSVIAGEDFVGSGQDS